ncbi:hypothetical protein SKAU_G00302800 [Synaphobranchus kaupii]|uniref:Uncharacterized protein n=1 Tax=Synaphobranchus kaupii TaxID=118154 RepID=A0A9Q1EW10_SYNKA|nr:hypothetical protein SKAU_G00302800 [Synaphobranchus kaupii]
MRRRARRPAAWSRDSLRGRAPKRPRVITAKPTGASLLFIPFEIRADRVTAAHSSPPVWSRGPAVRLTDVEDTGLPTGAGGDDCSTQAAPGGDVPGETQNETLAECLRPTGRRDDTARCCSGNGLPGTHLRLYFSNLCLARENNERFEARPRLHSRPPAEASWHKSPFGWCNVAVSAVVNDWESVDKSARSGVRLGAGALRYAAGARIG